MRNCANRRKGQVNMQALFRNILPLWTEQNALFVLEHKSPGHRGRTGRAVGEVQESHWAQKETFAVASQPVFSRDGVGRDFSGVLVTVLSA